MKLPDMDYVRHWWEVNARDLLRIITIVLAGFILALFVSLLDGQNKSQEAQLKQSGDNTRILNELSRQSKQRDRNVTKLISDNAQQTIILCTLIIGSNNGLTQAQVTSVETICNEQIKQISDGLGASASGTSGGTNQNVTGTQPGASSSPQSAPNTSPAQSQNPQPSGGVSQPVPPIPLNCKVDVLGIHLGCN